ncbi:transposable element Tcb1 transposase [Trichonephila clavipes]|nr:transposable element Tcb1 transposase [Trichonephila clavipes]
MAKLSYLPENKRYKIIHLKEEGYSMRQIAAKGPCGLSTVVIFSDESQFCISGNQSSAYVRRRTHEEFNPQCLKPTVKYPTKVIVWGCISSHGVGRLHIVSGTVKIMDYIEILQNKLLPTARDLLGNQSWIFQDEYAPCHRAKVVQKWFNASVCNIHDVRLEFGDTVDRGILNSCVMNHHTGPAPGIMDNARLHVVSIVQRFFVNHQIEFLPWPARSPDLSPIENMWSMAAQRFIRITPLAATPDQLWQRVETFFGLLYPKNTSKGFLNQCRGVWQR